MQGELWSVSFQEWNVEGRLALLDELNIPYKRGIGEDGNWTNERIYMIHPLSSGQMEVWKFVTDPVRKIDFSILDLTFGRALIKLHSAFWTWKFR